MSVGTFLFIGRGECPGEGRANILESDVQHPSATKCECNIDDWVVKILAQINYIADNEKFFLCR